MKRLISVFIALCLLVCLAACGAAPSGQTQPDSTPTTGETTEPTTQTNSNGVISQTPMAAVSVPSVQETFTADDGNTILTYVYQNMSLTLPDPDVADMIILDFLNRVDGTRATANSLLTAAKDVYTSPENWTPFVCHTTYNPTRIDQGVLSLYGTNVTYSGATHPERTCVSASYDLVTGDVLTLASIMSESATVDAFCQLVLQEMETLAQSKYLYDKDTYEYAVNQRFAVDSSKDEAWYFTQTGLCFYFEPYSVAPYSSGIITVEIPYEKLTGLLYDGYFPAERDMATGEMQIQPLADADMEQFTQITELTLDQDGQMLLLFTDKSVHNVQIDSGSWNESGTEFTKDHTVFASYELTPGDAIMVQAVIPDADPNLRLSYTANGETVFRFISCNSQDGSLILLK